MGFRAKIFLMSETGSVLVSKGGITFMRFRIMLFMNMHRYVQHMTWNWPYKVCHNFCWNRSTKVLSLHHPCSILHNPLSHLNEVVLWCLCRIQQHKRFHYDRWLFSCDPLHLVSHMKIFPFHLNLHGRVIYIVIVTCTEVSCSISCW